MTVQVIEKRTVKRVSRTRNLGVEALWHSVRGMWKGKKLDAVAYQRRVREEADAR